MTEEEQKAIENIEKELNKKYEVVPLYKDFSINSSMNIVQKHYNDTDIKIILNLISKLQSDIEIKDKVIDRTCKYINEAKIMNKAISVYPNIEEIKQHFYEEVEKENE